MANSTGPNKSESGLIFGYDTGDIINSYIGEPTTNLETANPVTFSGYGWGHTTTSVVQFQGRTCLRCHVFSPGNNPSWTGAYQGISAVGAVGDIFTRSCEVYIEPNGKHAWTPNVNATHGGSGGENTYYDMSRVGTWQKLEASVTNTSSSVPFYFYWFARGGGDPQDVDFVLYMYNPQLEKKDHATRFTASPRSTTQGLLDLTGANQIDLSNVTINSSQEIVFDGTDDFLTLGSDITFKTTGGWTVESVVYYNSVAGGYNNTTSPANFIGSEGINYNSWYWSVLDNRLALWNISPGYWRYGSTTLQPNRWYHVTITCSNDGTKYQFYLNGIAEGGDHVSQVWNRDYAGLKIRYVGKGNNGNPRLVNGKIPVTKVYNRPLLPSEIYNNFLGYKTRYNIT
jgi:hypothetical protein